MSTLIDTISKKLIILSLLNAYFLMSINNIELFNKYNFKVFFNFFLMTEMEELEWIEMEEHLPEKLILRKKNVVTLLMNFLKILF